jgi:3-oxoacyl-[acyl-carrier-protein] synthase-1
MPLPEKVHITGMGIISCIGTGVPQTLASLLACKTGIAALHHLKTVHRSEFVAGEIPYSDDELAQLAGTRRHSRTTLLAIIAAREAMQQAGIEPDEQFRTGLISSTTVAGMSDTELVYKDFFERKYQGNIIDRHFSGVSTNVLSETLGITDHVSTLSTACSSAANAILLGARLLRHRILDRVIVGGSDALSLFTLNGFNSLMILDKEWCKPFDEARRGLNLGEGAAYLVLESDWSLQRAPKKTLGMLSGYGNANDAYHQTASSPTGEGATLAMQKALKSAGLNTTQIDYINAHGTGTPNNDASEAVAMKNVFGETLPPFSSTKAFTGHTLAPAASIEAVISLLSLSEQTIFPSLNISQNMVEPNISPEKELRRDVPLTNIMSNSFGFGGNCSTLIFTKN